MPANLHLQRHSSVLSLKIMEAQNAESFHLKSREPAFLLMLCFLLLGLLPLSKETLINDSINFAFTSFDPNGHEIVCEGDAYTADNGIQLTINPKNKGLSYSVGRATYHKPMHLWDNSSGNLVLADFSTGFSFVIDSMNQSLYGDGFAFFLAPNGSKIPPQSAGGVLGLERNYSSSTVDPKFVAVEFDTFRNYWDPQGMSDHVAIDINSVQGSDSRRPVSWSWSDIENGGKVNASISYDSNTNTLSVLLFDANDFTRTNSSRLSMVLDLSEYLPEWVAFGFSGSTGSLVEVHTIYSWNFKSTLQVAANTSHPTKPPTAALVNPRRKSKTWLGVVLGAAAGGIFALFLALALLWFFYRRKMYGSKEDNTNAEMEMVTAPRNFSYQELKFATSNFTDQGLLGEGGFGKVYLGFLRDMNCNIAVKRITPQSQQGLKEYASEVKSISRLRHRNLVRLIGWCHDNQKFLIVYEFLPNKSLDYHLFREPCLLTWEKRYKIAMGLASALFYLQEECEQCVLHRDINVNNCCGAAIALSTIAACSNCLAIAAQQL